jgi:hypothetical protein
MANSSHPGDPRDRAGAWVCPAGSLLGCGQMGLWKKILAFQPLDKS